jgi:hypothetical protein
MTTFLKRAAFALLLASGLALGGVVSAQMGGIKEQPKKDEKKEEKKEESKDDGSKLPWSVDDIKKSIKKGGSMKFKLEQDANGTTTTNFMTTEITEVTDSGYKTKTTYTDKDGKPVEGMEADEDESEKAWGDMYGEFLNANVKVSDDKVKVGDKEYACKLYQQTLEETGAKIVLKIWFIKDKPGYLAKMVSHVEGEGFKQVTTVTLVEMK